MDVVYTKKLKRLRIPIRKFIFIGKDMVLHQKLAEVMVIFIYDLGYFEVKLLSLKQIVQKKITNSSI